MDDKEFNIIASAEAFETLSSKLYTNPIAAVIRELSSNAQDAHVAAHQEKHFYLHVPTSDERYFLIRDYGDGMSQDFVMSVFTTYFASTKTDNKNQIGAFGLGSKTPYALADEYEVTSYNGGKKIKYKMSKAKKSNGETGTPIVEKISEEPTNETGLEIFIDFKYSNIDCLEDKFRYETIDFFNKSAFQPDWNINLSDRELEIMAATKPYYNDNNVIYNFETDKMSKMGISRWSPAISINVAGVVFTVPEDKVHITYLKYDGVSLGSIFSKVNIMANKSDVSITPSRESLHYDDRTIEFIKNKVVDICGKEIDKLKEQVASVENDENSEIGISKLIWIANNFYSYDNEDSVGNMAQNVIHKAFEDIMFKFRGGSLVKTSFEIGSYYIEDTFYGILDTTGCKTAQLKTINKAIEETNYGEKITSALRTRAKYFFKEVCPNNCSEEVIVMVKDPILATKLLKNYENKKKFVYMDCTEKKEDGEKEHKKRGFITRNTYFYRNDMKDIDSNSSDCNRYCNNPYLEDDEIPLVINEVDRSKFACYADLLSSIVNPGDIGTVVLRIAGESSRAENIVSNFNSIGCREGISWIKEKINENVDKIDTLIKTAALKSQLSYIINLAYFCDHDFEETINRIDNLKLSKIPSEIRDALKYYIPNKELVSGSVYVALKDFYQDTDDKLTKYQVLEEFENPSKLLECDKYPMLSRTGRASSCEELFDMLNYMSNMDELESFRALQKSSKGV